MHASAHPKQSLEKAPSRQQLMLITNHLSSKRVQPVRKLDELKAIVFLDVLGQVLGGLLLWALLLALENSSLALLV